MAITISQLQSATNEQLLKLIDRRHPKFAEQSEHWRFMELCYRGGRKWIDENIFTYHKEGKNEFALRKKRAYRFPHSREVVNLVNKYVFKGSIERREQLPARIKEFWGATTMLKRPIADFMDNVSTWTSTYGRIWIVVDNNIPAGVESEKDRKDSKGRCYAYFLKPSEVYDFAYDEDGELLWLLNAEFSRDDVDPLTSSGEVTEGFRLWTKDFCCLIRVEVKNMERIATVDPTSVQEYKLGVVPVFPADHLTTDDPYTAEGLIDDVAYLDRAAANYLSNLDVIIQDQTFSQLAIPFQGLLPFDRGGNFDDDVDDQADHIQQMGTKRVFAYNAEGGSAPTFISPDVKQADIIMKAVTKIVGEIYHSVGAAGERTKEDNAAGIDNSSGVAKAYDFEKLNAMLAAKARSLQNIERNMVRLVNAWFGDLKELEETEELVSYPNTFDVRNLIDEMDNAQRLSVMAAPKTLRRAQMKRLVVKMFPQASKEEIDKITKDIEEEWLELSEELLTATLPTMGGVRPGKEPPKGNVPGKRNAQGENNKEAEK